MLKIGVIFAGGAGLRMAAGIPKQLMVVYGKPILIHTIEKFQYNPNIDKIYVACKDDLIPELWGLIKRYNLDKIPPTGVVAGGINSQESIYNVLCRVNEENEPDSIVLVHDGVRPLITDDVIYENIKGVCEYGSAITSKALFETPIISVDGANVDALPPRKTMYTGQAPQSFFLKDILDAHNKMRAMDPNYTDVVDCCTLMIKTGYPVHLVSGNRDNIKVTTVEDYAELLARMAVTDQKTLINLLSSKEANNGNDNYGPKIYQKVK